MKFITVLNSIKLVIIDDDDYNRVKRYNWFISSNDRGQGRIESSINGAKIPLGKFILGSIPEGKELVDHKDRDIFNNQKSNLRFATKAQNNANRSWRIGKSGYRGLTWCKRNNKWQVRITVKRITYNLGYFINKEEAAEAYNLGAIKYFGEFAVLNEITK